ncbi:phosphotransferase family protein [Streptomyces chumphonensis]|uniref:phosphotransferase family protein n=1 Tax=Streptomyces chumphonensis TaxID=1214925 RepID=UPI003D709E86
MSDSPGGFEPQELHSILARGCAAAGLDNRGARLLRGQTNAVVLLEAEHVVVKVARKGTPLHDVQRTVDFVRWLSARNFPTAPLHPLGQPIAVDNHSLTFWTYLPQPDHPVPAQHLARPLRALHTLPAPPQKLPPHDNLASIRRSLAAITWLPPTAIRRLSTHADRLERDLAHVTWAHPPGVIQGDPQHRNALHTPTGAVLCDWDTVAHGQPEWDAVTVEVHCRRFGHGHAHYQAFADAYGWDITRWDAYPVLAAIRELRMITTNARKVRHAPGSRSEVQRRIDGLDRDDHRMRWHIL